VVPPSVVPPSAAPTSKNWTQEGYVTPVKDQGDCGCCWAFGSTGALEGAYKKAKNKLLSFSEQELIECVKQWAGCGGGIEGDAFNLVKKNKGINLESTYPYTAMNSKYSKTCATGQAATRVSMNVAWSDIPKGDESLMKAIQTDGPIALSIALGDRFQYYSRGVMQPAQYCTKLNNHAVLLVGYGTDPVTKEDYWLVKNSWGTDWGEQGYFRMTRAVRNACGISNEAYRVIVS
jgi:C1A family cysteine protease